MANLTLLVLAAGMGSRYGGLKQIEPVGPDGETIMDYSIFDARRAGFAKVVFILRKEIEQAFKEALGRRFEKHIAVDYVFQELGKLIPGFSVPPGRTRPWGTTHAVLMAANTVREPFAVINADDFYGAEGYHALAQHLQSGAADYAMVGYTLRNTLSNFGPVARGVCRIDEHGCLLDIVEHTGIERSGKHSIHAEADGRSISLTGDEIVSMSLWGFTPHVFDQFREHFREFLQQYGSDPRAECYLPAAINAMLHAGEARVRVLRGSDAWFGVTYREDRPRAVEAVRRLIDSGYYPKRLWA